MKTRNTTKARQPGFSLVELLVVIGIIAVLAALLLPALSMAKARGRRVTCLSNVRQIDLGFRMYCDDSNDTSPTNNGALFGSQSWSNYRRLIGHYVGVDRPASPNDKLF